MRIAVFSDIHGNYQAFQAVLADMKHLHTDNAICLGDMVNYGADSEKVVQTFQSSGFRSVKGNHEDALFQPEKAKFFNLAASQSLHITKLLLSDKSLQYLAELPVTISYKNMLFVHGSPPDSVDQYIDSFFESELIGVMNNNPYPITFVGHTHYADLYCYAKDKVSITPLQKGITLLHTKKKYIVNVGSVGQSRDEDNCAKYVIFNTNTRELELRFVAYDINAATRAIIAAGYPEINAERLW